VFTLRPTLKLARKLRISIPDKQAVVQNPVADWCVHDFSAGRRYYLFVNTPSLFPVIVPARGLKTLDGLVRAFLEELKLISRGSPLQERQFERWIEPELSTLQLARIPNRSIMGSMNDFTRMARFHLTEDGDAPVAASRRLARAPMGYLDMDSPDRVFPKLKRD